MCPYSYRSALCFCVDLQIQPYMITFFTDLGEQLISVPFQASGIEFKYPRTLLEKLHFY